MKISNFIPLIIFFGILYYIAGAFYSTTFNIALWSEATRFINVVLFLSSLIMSFIFIYLDPRRQ